jgi:hypothetical protein
MRRWDSNVLIKCIDSSNELDNYKYKSLKVIFAKSVYLKIDSCPGLFALRIQDLITFPRLFLPSGP